MKQGNPQQQQENMLFSLVTAALKGISQVILIENAISGLLILIALLISSIPVGIIAFLSALIAVCMGRFGGADKTLVNQGLLAYNSVLTGIVLALNFTGGQRWVIALAGAAITTLLTAAMMHWMRNSGTPIFTFPFIIVSWFLLLASYRLGTFQLHPGLVPQDLSQWKLHQGGTIDWINGLVDGVGQVFLQDSIWSGILILAGVFWASRKLGFYAVIGSAAAWLAAYGLGGETALLNAGLYEYNAVLTILAVGAIFDAKSRWAPVSGLAAAIVSVPMTASFDSWLLPYGLPALTMPFVVCSWVFIAARKVIPKL
ncbi:urea transporter [Paenibacillus azoreducens]|uniref:urea transporter n=1 Tax=Paenibacillus azoreducens TaxID=116718 RepID=UPI0039F46E99